MNVVTESSVRASVQRVIDHAESIWDEWAWQVENAAWEVLGYDSWDAMRQGEYAALTSIAAPRAERPELVSRFRNAGLTQKETAATLGVSQGTVSHYEGSRPAPSIKIDTPAATQTPAPHAPPIVGGAGPYSSPVDAVGAPTGEVLTPPARPQVSRQDWNRERAEKAVERYPDLAYYFNQGDHEHVWRMAEKLNEYAQRGELEMRLDILRRSVAYDSGASTTPPTPASGVCPTCGQTRPSEVA